MAGRVYGKAYPIKEKEAKSYNRVSRRLRPNPIGVTNLAAVNGRGAYARSAREMAAGKTRSQRIAHAREVFKNGEKSMSLLKNRKSKASASAKRKKVAGTRYYKTPNGRYQNSKGKFVKASTVKKASRLRRNESVGYSESYSSGWDQTFGGSKAGAETPKKTRKKSARGEKGKKVAKKKVARKYPKGNIGKYRRVKLKNPRTGKSQLSYMYRDPKTKKLRRIPTKAVLKYKHKTPEKLEAARERHATRVKKVGDVFVANKKAGGSTAKRKRAGRRLAAYNAALRAGKSKTAATRIALRKVPLSSGDSFKGATKEGGKKRRKTVSRRRKTTAVKTATTRRRKKAVAKKTVRRKRKKATTTRRKKATTTRRKKATTRRKKATTTRRKKATTKRRKKATTTRRKKATSSTRRRRQSAAKATAPRKRRKSKAVKSTRRAKSGRRKSARRYRRNGGSVFRKNNFLGNLQAVLKTGLFVTTGFLTHRIVTNLVVDKLLSTTLPDNETFQQWKKPVVGLGVLGLGVAVSGAVAKRNAMELGAGMVASWLQSVIVSGINAAGKPELLESVAGYSNSRAWDLRGVRRRRRGLRGSERNAVSIGPRYTPVGQFQQAAAGQFQQAAAGQFQQAAAGTLGEYFTASPRGVGEYYQATGEYFAPNGMKGVGAYEPAGELAMQASAGVNQIIRDGVRPDGDLDRALDLAEAAAGVGEVPQLNRVPQQSQWIPNGPLWAGETAVRDTQAKSEVSAGILARTGGNGILSS